MKTASPTLPAHRLTSVARPSPFRARPRRIVLANRGERCLVAAGGSCALVIPRRLPATTIRFAASWLGILVGIVLSSGWLEVVAEGPSPGQLPDLSAPDMSSGLASTTVEPGVVTMNRPAPSPASTEAMSEEENDEEKEKDLDGGSWQDSVVLPNPTNAVQFRLYTNASPRAPHLFNTFDITAYGRKVVDGPCGGSLQRWLAAPASPPVLHSILINEAGPILDPSSSLKLVEQASGPEWTYVAFDATAAYSDRLKIYRRGLLFVEPDLFVLYDHLVAKEPVHFQMLLHPPSATLLNTNWGDLRLEVPGAGFRINAPSRRGSLRFWEQVNSSSDTILPVTVTMKLGPTNRVEALDLLTVYAVHSGGKQSGDNYYSFKLLESNTAVGARIHRAGLPTLVAFRVDPAAAGASLHGFKFDGPVGVDVFRPKRRTR